MYKKNICCSNEYFVHTYVCFPRRKLLYYYSSTGTTLRIITSGYLDSNCSHVPVNVYLIQDLQIRFLNVKCNMIYELIDWCIYNNVHFFCKPLTNVRFHTFILDFLGIFEYKNPVKVSKFWKKYKILFVVSIIISTFAYTNYSIMNPFIQNFRLKVIKVHAFSYETNTADIKDGYVGKFRTVEESFYAEQQNKTSVYDIPYIENILFKELKSAGRDLLLYIMYNIEKDSDTIILKPEKVMNKMDCSKGTYYSSIQQLIDVGIICKKHVTEYWVNPFFIFKGNRIEYYNKVCPDCIDTVAEIVKKTKMPRNI